jgi:23S rRNA U2552 (ribose-2'-O)-methylase RlmE/FtsJ
VCKCYNLIVYTLGMINQEYIFKINEIKNDLPNKLEVKQTENDIVYPIICKKISECKCLIDIEENSKHWDKAKRRTNPHEFVHIIGTNHIKNEKIKKINFDNYTPLSRAFFKMIEIYEELDIIPNNFKNKGGYIAHLAEGPGGFMEALYKKRHLLNLNDKFYGLTLEANNKNIPGWTQLKRRRTHPLHNSNVKLLTGDMYNVKTIIEFAKNFTKNKAFLVTCDGGFDYSKDFNNQERNSWRIIFSEIVTGLLVQKKGGNFICKMFDLFTKFSLQMIYILKSLYNEVYIFKPKTSRPANSEKYIIAKGFKGIKKSLISSMLGLIKEWEKLTTKNNSRWLHLEFSNIKLPNDYIENIRKINVTLSVQQEEYILLTLENIKDNTNHFKETQLSLAKEWFKKYNVSTKDNIKHHFHKI